MTHIRLTLDYPLAAGWQRPWIDALADGQVLARRCSSCQRTSFVPLRVCDCGGSTADWVKLSGNATITQRSTGQDGDFALVRFEGADTLTTVRLIAMPTNAVSGKLLKPNEQRPVLLLGS